MTTFRANLSRLAVILFLGALSACASPAEQNPESAATQLTLFRNGQASMTCGLSCAFTYGAARKTLQYEYDTRNWTGLSSRLLAIGYDGDQSWYYLGRAAQGLGYGPAAQTYFTNALFATLKCGGMLNVCDGLNIPALAQNGIDTIVAAEAPNDTPGQAPPAWDAEQAAGPPPQPPPPDQTGGPGNDVTLVDDNGTFEVPVLINGLIPLNFIVDSGASDVSIPADVALTLMRTGTVQNSDFLGSATYTLADGSTVPSARFTIRSLKVGNQTLHNVDASVGNANGPLLLGESFLSRFHSWSIDNSRNVLALR